MPKRLSVSLTEADELRVDEFSSGSQRSALERAVGARIASEAAVLRALAEVGARTLEEDLLDAGYAEAAAHYAEGDEDRREARRRHLERSGRQL